VIIARSSRHGRPPATTSPTPACSNRASSPPRQIAHLTGVSTGTMHYWINSGYPAARRGPVGFQNSATRLDLGFYAARSYSLMRRRGRAGA
jgi:hypothetical protein